MTDETRVMRSDDPRLQDLLRADWKLVARSWGAQLNAEAVDNARLESFVKRVSGTASIRELANADQEAILALDRATLNDYPGSVATIHAPLTIEGVNLSPQRRAFGAETNQGELVAMTFVDIDAKAETDFTVVAPEWRGQKLATAVKAASVMVLIADGVRVFRTGGSADNAPSIAANTSVGYALDEEWLTLTAPAR
ncbi:MAG: acetyltransferase [Leifsonia sp.]